MKPDFRDGPGEPGAQKRYLNYLLVYLLLFVSGSSRYQLSPDKFLIMTFLVAIGAWLLFSDRKFSDRFLLYTIVFSSLLVSLHLYTGGSQSLTSVIASIMKIVLAYLVIRTVREEFVEAYIKVVVFLAVVSLLGYVTDVYRLFDGIILRLPRVGTAGYEGFLYTFRQYNHIDRNNSIFFEPGAYQAFLNAALFMLFFVKTRLGIRKTWIYILILATALTTTFSTTGLLIFSAMLALFFFRSSLLTAAGKIKVAVVIVVVIGAFASQFYSAVVVKVEEYLTAGEYDRISSARTRSSHLKADLKVFRAHPFGLGNREYTKAFGIARRIDVQERNTSSNGVTKTLAVFGLPFSVFIFGSYMWALRRLLGEFLLSGVAFTMFLMFLAGESYYISAPICYAVIASAFVYKRVPERGSLQMASG